MNNKLRKLYSFVLFNNIKKNGVTWLFKKILLRGCKEFFWLILLPISISLHYFGIRRLLIRIEHIGHLAAEFDSYIKEQRLGLWPKNFRYHFVLAPKSEVSNNHLLKYWMPYVRIFQNPFVCSFLKILTYRYFMRDDVSRYVSSFFGTQHIYKINKLWGNQAPILSLTKEDEEWGRVQLEKLGISQDKWFVCLHVREGGFLPHNEIIQSHRNASIENVMLAIDEIIKRGGVVVRMGDSSMTPLFSRHGVIDYAHHAMKSDRLDVILCAKAKFFLGCSSGLFFVSTIFGVPVAQVNMIPIEVLSVCKNDISIPKLLWSNSENRYLHFQDILSSSIGGYFFTYQYQSENIIPIENTPDEILEITCEMLDRIDGTFQENEKDIHLHKKYLSLFKAENYSDGGESKICFYFLRKHQNLILREV